MKTLACRIRSHRWCALSVWLHHCQCRCHIAPPPPPADPTWQQPAAENETRDQEIERRLNALEVHLADFEDRHREHTHG